MGVPTIRVGRTGRAAADLEPLARVCETVTEAIASFPELREYDVPDAAPVVDLALGGPRDCRDWNVPTRSLGFHAITSLQRRDRRTGERYFEVADRHLAIVNLETGRFLLDRTGDPFFPDDVESWAVTVAHELLHALEWIRETGGRTPDDLFRASPEDWPAAAGRILSAVDRRLGGEGAGHDAGEDAIERQAREWTARLSATIAECCADVFERTLVNPSPG